MNTVIQVSAIVALGAAAFFLALAPTNPPASGGTQSAATIDVALIASDLGLVPEALTVAGIVSSNDVKSIYAKLDEADSLRQAYIDARLAIDETGETLTKLSGLVRIDAGDANLTSQYTSAVAELAAAQQALEKAKGELFSAAVDGLPTQAVANLQIWRESAHRSIPPEFRVLQRSDEEWKAIESALRAQQRSDQFGTPLDPAHSTLLNQTSTELAVIEAANNLAAYLPSVKSAAEEQLAE